MEMRDADEAYLICVREGEEADVEASQRACLWASTRHGNARLVEGLTSCAEKGPDASVLLVFTSFKKDPEPRPLYGIARITGAPQAGTAGTGPWVNPQDYAELMSVEWIFKNKGDLPSIPEWIRKKYDATRITNDIAKSCINLCEQHKRAKKLAKKHHYRQPLQDDRDKRASISQTSLHRQVPGIDQEMDYGEALYDSLEGSGDAGESAPLGPSGKPRRSRIEVEFTPEIPFEEASRDAPMCDIQHLAAPVAPRSYWDPQTSDLHFCVYDIDYTELAPLYYTGENARLTMDILPNTQQVPVLRLYGVTREGYQANALVRGFLPYLYANVPEDFRRKMVWDRVQYPNTLLDSDPKSERAVAMNARQSQMCSLFRASLNNTLREKLKDYEQRRYPKSDLVYKLELVRRETIEGYAQTLDWFFKITLCSPKLVVRAREILTSGEFRWAGSTEQAVRDYQPRRYQVYEANIPFALRFMIDQDLYGCSWVTLKRHRYLRWANPETENETFSDIEVTCNANDVIAHAPDDPEWSDMPLMRKLTFDIECEGLKGRFPLPFETNDKGKMIPKTGDPVICIAARLTEEGGSGATAVDKKKRVMADVVFTWGKCNVTQVAHVLSYYQKRGKGDPPLPRSMFENPNVPARAARTANGETVFWTQEDEAVMLQQFRDFIVKLTRPQIICGYNITGFDMPYLVDRAASLGLGTSFSIIGMSKRDQTRVKERVFSSKAYGNRKVKEFNIPGRLVLDCLAVVLRDFKFRSYTLNAVAEELLKDSNGNATERKADVPHTQIGPLWRANNETRRRVVEYCWKDVDITDKLEQKVVMFIDKVEMSRATGVPFSYIITRGQQIKVLSLVMREAKLQRRIVLTREHKEKIVEQEKYKGATVIEPKPAFYDECVATLDFSALYPSIMRSKNMCYTTILNARQRAQFRPDQLYVTPTENGDVVFVKEGIKQGILPLILTKLTDKRNAAKGLAKKNAGTPAAIIYDRRQNALKVTSNSVYGFTGAAATGTLPCPDIAMAVTSTGRIGIELTARMVETPYSEIPRDESSNETDEAYQQRCAQTRAEYPLPRLEGETVEEHAQRIKTLVEIIYGDTDSVMVRMRGMHDPAKSIDLGKKYATWITKWFFKSPMAILFEKIYYPYLLVAKKRYAGMLWTNPDKPDKKDVKGMESVRRDNCLLVKGTIDTMIKTILQERDLTKMVKILVDRVRSVSTGTIDLSMLIISKALSKEPEAYKPCPPQAQVALNMRARDPHTAPKMGDRVPYLITAYGGKKDKISKKAEHPIEVMNKNIPIDKNYYIDRQLRKPCERILEPLLPGITDHIFSNLSSTVYLPARTATFSRASNDSSLPGQAIDSQPVTKRTVFVKGKLKERTIPKNRQLVILPGQLSMFGEQLSRPKPKITDAQEGHVKLEIRHSIRVEEPSTHKNSIGNFVTRILSCAACGSASGLLVCKQCEARPQAKETLNMLREDALQVAAKQRSTNDKYWRECVVECQKVSTVEDLSDCANWECPNFFQRAMSKTNLLKTIQKLERFDSYLKTSEKCSKRQREEEDGQESP